VDFSLNADGANQIVAAAKLAAQNIHLDWSEKNYLLLRRGSYVIASGLDESISDEPHKLTGNFVSLFDSELRVQKEISITPGTRQFLLDLDLARTGQTHLLMSACKALLKNQTANQINFTVEGVGDTPAIVLLEARRAPRAVTLNGINLTNFEYSAKEKLLWIHFKNDVAPRKLTVVY
jgi:hypothetical protein